MKYIFKVKHQWLTSFTLCLSSQLLLTSQLSYLLHLTQILQRSNLKKMQKHSILCHKSLDDQERLCQSVPVSTSKKKGDAKSTWGSLVCFGGPFLSAMAGGLADVVNGSRSWRISGSTSFILLCIGLILISILYLILYWTIKRKLQVLYNLEKGLINIRIR